jgi:hypothetical protein
MLAAGKTNASQAREGDRILIQFALGGVPVLSPTKTGAEVVRITGKSFAQAGRGQARGTFTLHTTAGDIAGLQAIQTMWLAPEDAAGVKRAEKEAREIHATVTASAETVVAEVFAETHPDAVIRHAVRPTSTDPEVGFSSQCRKAECPGHWRTGLETAAAARAAYAAHPCGVAEAAQAQAEVDQLLEEAAPAAPVEAPAPATVAELKETEPTSSSALVLIGRCWAGGLHTGSALKAWHSGDFTLAAAFALDQLSLQAETTDPLEAQMTVDTQEVARDAYWTRGCGADILARHQAEAAGSAEERGRLAEAKLARAVLADYQAAARIIDAPKVFPVTRQANGTLMVENAGGDPAGQEAAPRAARVVRGDVVRIHRGTALYEVLRVETDHATDRTRPGSEPEDFSMAQLIALDPDDDRPARWESLDLLHRVPPVARVRTLPVGGRQELAEDFVVVAGPGWERDMGPLRQPALTQVSGTRLPAAALIPVGAEVREDPDVVPVGCLRIGDAIVINDRCFTVTWDGGPAEPRLEPTRWRDR